MQFSPQLLCFSRLNADKYGLISNTEGSNLKCGFTIILHICRWFTMPSISSHLNEQLCGASCKSLFPTGTHIWWRDHNNGSSGHMNQRSPQQKCYHNPQSVRRSTVWNWNSGESLIELRQVKRASYRGLKANHGMACVCVSCFIYFLILKTQQSIDKSRVYPCTNTGKWTHREKEQAQTCLEGSLSDVSGQQKQGVTWIFMHVVSGQCVMTDSAIIQICICDGEKIPLFCEFRRLLPPIDYVFSHYFFQVSWSPALGGA